MKIFKEEVLRYGEYEFDKDYIKWGFNDEKEQISDAKKLIKLFPKNAKSILDVACGIGRYHRVWLEYGYNVSGTDLSKYFINHAKTNNPKVKYFISDAQKMITNEKYDVITAIEPGIMNVYVMKSIYECLNEGGVFILDTRNPNHPKYKGFRPEYRSWTYENGTYKLFRHEYNFISQEYEHEEITIDPTKDEIIIKKLGGGDIPMLRYKETLIGVGFKSIETYSREGEVMDFSDESIAKIWLVAKK